MARLWAHNSEIGFNCSIPCGGVVHLKGIVETVLPHPKCDRLATHRGTNIDALFGNIERRFANGRIGVRKSA
jgi:hypothetical protein